LPGSNAPGARKKTVIVAQLQLQANPAAPLWKIYSSPLTRFVTNTIALLVAALARASSPCQRAFCRHHRVDVSTVKPSARKSSANVAAEDKQDYFAEMATHGPSAPPAIRIGRAAIRVAHEAYRPLNDP